MTYLNELKWQWVSGPLCASDNFSLQTNDKLLLNSGQITIFDVDEVYVQTMDDFNHDITRIYKQLSGFLRMAIVFGHVDTCCASTAFDNCFESFF